MSGFWMSVIILSALLLSWLSIGISNSNKLNHYDLLLHNKLVKKTGQSRWRIIAFINDPKLMVVWAVLLAAFLINQKRLSAALWVLATLGGTDLAGILLKKLVKRKRPHSHLNAEHGYSFPSGHVLGASSMLLMLLQLFNGSWGWIFDLMLLVIWLLIIASRLSLKAHYPSDIVGAATLALLCFGIAEEFVFLI